MELKNPLLTKLVKSRMAKYGPRSFCEFMDHDHHSAIITSRSVNNSFFFSPASSMVQNPSTPRVTDRS